MTQQEQIWQDVMELANRPGTFTHGLWLHVTGIGDGWAEGELTAGDGMLNPLGIVHGGVYAAMMDHVAGTAAGRRKRSWQPTRLPSLRAPLWRIRPPCCRRRRKHP